MYTPILRLPLHALLLTLLLGITFPVQAQPTHDEAPAATSPEPESATDAATPTTLPQPALPPETTAPTEFPPAEPPQPAEPPPPTLSDLGRSLRSYFTEDELDLLFQYMKESVIASFKGEEVSLPPDLSFKLEILLVRLKKESDHYMDNLIKQIEADLKSSLKKKLKDSLTPPPIKDQPYNPWLNMPWK